MTGFDDLYQEIILDHNRRPRNFGAMPEADRKVEGYNPLCGDRVTVFLKLAEEQGGERIADIAFEGSGCAISTASASLMTEALKGRTVAEAEALFQKVHALLAGRQPAAGNATPNPDDPDDPFGEVGQLAALAGVRNYPMRVKCATLAWHALHSALAPAAPSPSAGNARTEA